MLILLYILLVLDAFVWFSIGRVARTQMRMADGVAATGTKRVIAIVVVMALLNLFIIGWLATGQITITH